MSRGLYLTNVTNFDMFKNIMGIFCFLGGVKNYPVVDFHLKSMDFMT